MVAAWLGVCSHDPFPLPAPGGLAKNLPSLPSGTVVSFLPLPIDRESSFLSAPLKYPILSHSFLRWVARVYVIIKGSLTDRDM